MYIVNCKYFTMYITELFSRCLQEEALTNWTISRSVDGNDKSEFLFDDIKIRPNGRVKVS